MFDLSRKVHGDYRMDNLIFHSSGEVAAVLDWELSTLGDPVADLAYISFIYCCFVCQSMYVCPFSDCVNNIDFYSCRT